MNHRTTFSIRRAAAAATCVALALAGCGGGSDSPATPTSPTIAGTAAKGATLPRAAVSIKFAALAHAAVAPPAAPEPQQPAAVLVHAA